MNFIQKQVDLQAKLPDIILTRHLDINANDVSPAAKYINPETKEYHHLASDQYTVTGKDISANLNILSPLGKELYNSTLQRIATEGYKGTFTKYFLDISNSGFWQNNPASPFYDTDDCQVALNSFHNRRINGILTSGDRICTSVLIFLTSEWALTKSGSIYRLLEETESYAF